MAKHLPVSRPYRQKGVGLIDVMIAVVVFSVGMLALATLQTVNKQSNYEAIQRSSAALLSNDLMERMRMNSLREAASIYKSSLGHYVPSSVVELSYNDTLTAPGTNCNSSVCNSAQLAAWDLYEFQLMLRGANETASGRDVGGLFNPTACLSTSTTGGRPGQYTVTIVWRGQVKLENQSASACGNGNYGANNEFRRIFQVTSHMNCPEPGGCET